MPMPLRPDPMVRVRRALMGLSLGVLTAVPAAAQTLSLTGEVRAIDAEAIYVPPTNSSPVVLRYYVPEGQQVSAGDVLVRIDPGQSLSQIRELDAKIEQTQATAEKEAAELDVKLADAEIALVQATAVRDKARIDAGIPRQHISGLDYDRYQSALETAVREHALKSAEFEAAREAVVRRRGDGKLELRKLETEREYHRLQVANSEQRATRAGVVVHGFDPWQGQRYDEGSSAQMGMQIGEVIGDGALGVRAWALEPERSRLSVGQEVAMVFDALPEAQVRGRITRIGGAPEPKAEWGSARWFLVEIDFLDSVASLGLLPGMSVRVEVSAAGAVAVAEAAP